MRIEEAASAGVAGLRVIPRGEQRVFEGPWLTAWFPDVFAEFLDRDVTVNFLRARPGPFAFTQTETHTGREIFAFTQGVSTMLVLDAGRARLLSFSEGDLAIVEAGLPHYLGPALTDCAACAVAASRRALTTLTDYAPDAEASAKGGIR